MTAKLHRLEKQEKKAQMSPMAVPSAELLLVVVCVHVYV